MLFVHELGEPQGEETTNTITFQGVKFNCKVPMRDEAFCPNVSPSMERMVSFLREVEEQNRVKGLIRGGLIIQADDQFIN